MADGWFPSVELQAVEAVVARLHQYIREEGRDPSEVGMEGSVSIGDGSPETWIQQALAWRNAGATHLSVSTTGVGFSSPDQHIDALRRFKEASAGVL